MDHDMRAAGSPLFVPYVSPGLSLPNRIVVAPKAQGRAGRAGVPDPLTRLHYARQAGAGLIVSEGIVTSRRGQGHPAAPGLYSHEQVGAWREVTTAVHAAGGRIFARLVPGGPVPLPCGRRDRVLPATADMGAAIEDHAAAARNAIRAGFDGVELPGCPTRRLPVAGADLRQDTAAAHHRIRFPIELVEAVAAVVGEGRVALRLSPESPADGIFETDPAPVHRALVDALSPFGLAYLHVVDGLCYPALRDLRPRWSGTLVGNVGPGPRADRMAGETLLVDGLADLVAFDRLPVADPARPGDAARGLIDRSAPAGHAGPAARSVA
ncbi:MAG TPA: alkene reductase [Alphaproteobacteria bacterium]|nr:alkene reductase [Alphaproteobacteria bacterium]